MTPSATSNSAEVDSIVSGNRTSDFVEQAPVDSADQSEYRTLETENLTYGNNWPDETASQLLLPEERLAHLSEAELDFSPDTFPH